MNRSLRSASALPCGRLCAAFVVVHGLAVGTARGGDESPMLLPDIIVPRSYLSDHDYRTVAGRRLLRLSNGTANVGSGPLHLYGVLPGNGDGTQDVRQRVYREDGSTFDRVAGEFLYHSGHNHIHFNDWAHYLLRRRVGVDGVGEVIAAGEKTSFCILDLQVYDRNLPNYRAGGQFRSCSSTTQGLSVGWIDIYDKSLEGQNIDITDVPDGHYWIESIVDPDNHVIEANEDNNVTRLAITIGNPPDVTADRFEPNDSRAAVAALAIGTPNSAHLGPVNPKFTGETLTLDDATDVDYFRFYSNDAGGELDFVRVDFRGAQGNVDLELLDDTGAVVASSTDSGTDVERIALTGHPEGWYWVRVFGAGGDTSPDYTLTINPPANTPPTIATTAPVAGNQVLLHGLDVFDVEWQASDTENDEMWVTVYFNDEPVLDEDAILVPTAKLSPADLGFAVINTAEVAPGTYWVYCEVTDGGSIGGDWSEGTITLLELDDGCVRADGTGDCNGNRVVDSCEIDLGLTLDCNENGVPDSCDLVASPDADADGDGILDDCQRVRFHRADPNDDGGLDVSDAVTIIGYLFRGNVTLRCLESADTNNDHVIDVTDVIFSLEYLFRGGVVPPSPGPPASGCGFDVDAPDSAGFIGCDAYTSC